MRPSTRAPRRYSGDAADTTYGAAELPCDEWRVAFSRAGGSSGWARRDRPAHLRRHRRIGNINGEASIEASRQRFRGYRQALATADLPFDPDLVREGNWQTLSGYKAARALMNLKRAPTDLLRQ